MQRSVKQTIKISVMENKPFTSQYSNVYNEALYRTVPDPYGLKNVTGTQIQNRNICDTSTISVPYQMPANPQQQNLAGLYPQCVNCPAPQIRTMQQQIPGGVRFTFLSSPKIHSMQNFSTQNPYSSQPPPQIYSCNPGQQEIDRCVNPQLQYFNKPCMPNQCNVENQTQVRENPYQLKFHYNGQTSTADLLAGPNQMQPSMGTPDFNNLAGIIETIRNSIETEFPIVVQQSTKILLLTKSPDIKQTSEAIREQDKAPPPPEFVDKNLQTERRVSIEEKVDEEPDQKSKKKSNKKRKRKTRRSSKNRTKCKDLARQSESESSLSLTNNSDDYDDEEDTEDNR